MPNENASLKTELASPILARYQPDDDTRKIATQSDNAISVLDGLADSQAYQAAIDFLCYWMPPQHAIWWGCICLWENERERNLPSNEKAMQLIIAWLQEPNESNRATLNQIETSLAPQHPISFLAKAALFSSGSMVALNLPPVAPPKYLYCRFVGCSIKLDAANANPEEYASTYNQIIQFGLEVLQGSNRWYRRKTRAE